MAKYLHYFRTREEFENTYYDDLTAIVTAITCSAGTYVFDREETIVYKESDPFTVYVWTLGSAELQTDKRNPEVGDGAYDPNTEEWLEITAVSTEEHEPGYHEPWVSLTPGYTTNMFSAKLDGSGDTQTYIYIGECRIDFVK
jgi:hypothetical protein